MINANTTNVYVLLAQYKAPVQCTGKFENDYRLGVRLAQDKNKYPLLSRLAKNK